MKIHLWHSDTCEWKLHNSENEDFKKQLESRKIIISNYAKIDNYAEIGK